MAVDRHALLIGIEKYPHVSGADLAGPRNDVIEIANLLFDRFGFPEDNVEGLLDAETTRAAIAGAFEGLCERVEKDDVVVVYYSGHGSRVVQGGLGTEAIVPSDSGRAAPHGDGTENRDIYDHEVNAWIERLNERTPHVTLIFDCCHSGTLSRDPFATGVREIVPDQRPLEPATSAPDAAAGFLRERRRAVVLAACREVEEAKEYRPSIAGKTYAHGVFTYFLTRALHQAGKDTTWRAVFEAVAPRVTDVYQSQSPQIEGRWDTTLFGVHEHRPRAYLRVKAVAGKAVELAGGAAHGLAPGAVWSLHPGDASHPAAATELARVAVETVAPAASTARLVGEQTARPEVGQRAFLREQRAAHPALAVLLADDEAPKKDRERLRRRLGRAALLRPAGDGERADLVVRYLTPRAAVDEGASCPLLGLLEEATWAAVGTDGHLAARTRPAGPGALVRLLEDLERVARYRGLAAIENPDPAHPLRDAVDFRVERFVPSGGSRGEDSGDGTFVAAETEPGDGLIRFGWGEGMEFVIHNRHDAPLYCSLLHFGCDRSIDLLLPNREHPHFRPGGYCLESAETLRVAADYYSRFHENPGFTVTRPEGFPWAAEPSLSRPGQQTDATGLVHLRLMVTSAPADFEFVCQERTRDPGFQEHPLLELSRLYYCGDGTRGTLATSGETAWTTVQKSLRVGAEPGGRESGEQHGT